MSADHPRSRPRPSRPQAQLLRRAGCAAPTTRTSARSICASRWSAAWSAASCPRSCARSSTSRATPSSPTGRSGTRSSPSHGLLMIFFSVMPATVRRLRQLVRAADDRRARHGVPAAEQHQLLAAAAGVPADHHRPVPGRVGHRLDAVSAARRTRPTSPASAWTARCSRCIWPASARCSAPSTSSPPSSTCARPA